MAPPKPHTHTVFPSQYNARQKQVHPGIAAGGQLCTVDDALRLKGKVMQSQKLPMPLTDAKPEINPQQEGKCTWGWSSWANWRACSCWAARACTSWCLMAASCLLAAAHILRVSMLALLVPGLADARTPMSIRRDACRSEMTPWAIKLPRIEATCRSASGLK